MHVCMYVCMYVFMFVTHICLTLDLLRNKYLNIDIIYMHIYIYIYIISKYNSATRTCGLHRPHADVAFDILINNPKNPNKP
jgi:hypothetical protein